MLFYSYTDHWFGPGRRGGQPVRVLANGVFFGLLAVVLMIARIRLTEGVFIDARNVPVALIGLFEGWPAGLVAALVAVTYRLWLGGPGAGAGIIGVLVAGAAGGLFHAWAQRQGGVGRRHIVVLTGVVFATTFATFVLVGAYGVGLFHRVWLPLAAAYLVGIGGGAHLMRDVAERARLHAERERFRAILDEAGEAIRIQDADTFRILDCNRKDCELSGYRRQEMIGRDAREFWPVEPELRARREAVAAEARIQGAARGFGLPYRTRGGETISVDSTRRIVEREGRRYEIVIFRDAADREAAEAARREAAELRALTLVAGAAAHEINNPLMVISGAVELLGRRLPADGPEARLIEQTRDGVRRVKDIVLRMGRITRIEAEPDRGHLPAMLDIRKSSDPGSP